MNIDLTMMNGNILQKSSRIFSWGIERTAENVNGSILRCFLSFVNITTAHERERDTRQRLLTCEYIQVSVLGLILGELRILHGVVPGFGLYELIFFTETDVPVDVKTRDMLNKLLDGHGGPLAVLLTVFPFLKSGNISRRIIQIIVGSVEAFPKDRSI